MTCTQTCGNGVPTGIVPTTIVIHQAGTRSDQNPVRRASCEDSPISMAADNSSEAHSANTLYRLAGTLRLASAWPWFRRSKQTSRSERRSTERRGEPSGCLTPQSHLLPDHLPGQVVVSNISHPRSGCSVVCDIAFNRFPPSSRRCRRKAGGEDGQVVDQAAEDHEERPPGTLGK